MRKTIFNFNPNYLYKKKTKKILIDNHYETIYESVRSECSSCRVYRLCLSLLINIYADTAENYVRYRNVVQRYVTVIRNHNKMQTVTWLLTFVIVALVTTCRAGKLLFLSFISDERKILHCLLGRGFCPGVSACWGAVCSGCVCLLGRCVCRGVSTC